MRAYTYVNDIKSELLYEFNRVRIMQIKNSSKIFQIENISLLFSDYVPDTCGRIR